MFFKILWALLLNIVYCMAVYGIVAPWMISAKDNLLAGGGFILVMVAIIFQIWANWAVFKKAVVDGVNKFKDEGML